MNSPRHHVHKTTCYMFYACLRTCYPVLFLPLDAKSKSIREAYEKERGYIERHLPLIILQIHSLNESMSEGGEE